MKPYPTYKDSGQPWLGSIPEHWKLMRAKWLFDELSEKNHPDKPLLSATQDKGVYPRELSENRVMMPMGELDGFKLVRPGEFVISLRSFEGGIEHSAYEGLISPAYTVLRRRRQLNDLYFKYLLKSDLYVQELNTAVTGIRDGQSIRYKDFGEARLPFPGLLEQAAIVAFLDRKTADIERFITQKRQLIALLNEQKAAMINRAVTQGQNPDVPRKASGVEWLGEVPAHWEVRRLRFLAELNPSKTPSTNNRPSEQQVVFLPMENISVDGKIDNSTKKPISEVSNGFTFFSRGDVVIAKITPCFENGKGAWLENLETDIGFGTTELIVLRPHKEVWAQFLYFVTASSAFRTQGEAIMTGSAGQQRVPTDFVRDYPVALPPFREQQEITKFIELEKAKVNEAISRIEREIELIQEYRTTLVSDAVTGKIDVREVARDAENAAANLTT